MADDTTDWISKLKDISSIKQTNLGDSITKVVLLPIIAFFMSVAAAIEAGASIFIDPMEALGTGISNIVSALTGGAEYIGAAGLIDAGAQASKEAADVFGILGWPMMIAIALLGAFVYAEYLEAEATSDLLPFSLTDIPLIGADEEED